MFLLNRHNFKKIHLTPWDLHWNSILLTWQKRYQFSACVRMFLEITTMNCVLVILISKVNTKGNRSSFFRINISQNTKSTVSRLLKITKCKFLGKNGKEIVKLEHFGTLSDELLDIGQTVFELRLEHFRQDCQNCIPRVQRNIFWLSISEAWELSLGISILPKKREHANESFFFHIIVRLKLLSGLMGELHTEDLKQNISNVKTLLW